MLAPKASAMPEPAAIAPRALFAETVLSDSVTAAFGPRAVTPAPAARPVELVAVFAVTTRLERVTLPPSTRIPPPTAATSPVGRVRVEPTPWENVRPEIETAPVALTTRSWVASPPLTVTEPAPGPLMLTGVGDHQRPVRGAEGDRAGEARSGI